MSYFKEKYLQVILDYDDITIIPNCISDIKSRDEIDTSVKLGDLTIKVPIMVAPMVGAVGENAQSIFDAGAFPILHRFQSIADQVEQFKICNRPIAAAIGISEVEIGRYHHLYDNGCRIFCIDVANGANTHVGDFIKHLASQPKRTGSLFIVGNVATIKQVKYLQSLPNVAAIRLFQAPGRACRTKHSTGIYTPPITTLFNLESYQNSNGKFRAKIIADGGISEAGHFCKAIAFSADFAMIGGAFAACTDSPAEKISKDGKIYSVFSGSASYEIQKKYKDVPRYIEGATITVPSNNMTSAELVTSYQEGLKSLMSYCNARTITELQSSDNYLIYYRR